MILFNNLREHYIFSFKWKKKWHLSNWTLREIHFPDVCAAVLSQIYVCVRNLLVACVFRDWNLAERFGQSAQLHLLRLVGACERSPADRTRRHGWFPKSNESCFKAVKQGPFVTSTDRRSHDRWTKGPGIKQPISCSFDPLLDTGRCCTMSLQSSLSCAFKKKINKSKWKPR